VDTTSLLSKLPRLIVPLVACLICQSPSGAQDVTTGAQNKQNKPPIQGGVEQDDVLPGLPDKYKEGSPLDKADLQRLTPDNNWFPIPEWFAGKWFGEDRVVESVQSYRTGLRKDLHITMKQPIESSHGHQRDKTGQIWEYIEIPRWKQADLRLDKQYLRLLRQDVIESNSTSVVLKDLHNQMVVGDDAKQIILSSFLVQQKSIYVPEKDGHMTLLASMKKFDSDGKPMALERCSMLLTRTGPYTEVDSLDGLDLKQLFVEYLKKIGRPDLLPAQ